MPHQFPLCFFLNKRINILLKALQKIEWDNTHKSTYLFHNTDKQQAVLIFSKCPKVAQIPTLKGRKISNICHPRGPFAYLVWYSKANNMPRLGNAVFCCR
jgi:hypothetical protein